jgi:hypothetical protein
LITSVIATLYMSLSWSFICLSFLYPAVRSNLRNVVVEWPLNCKLSAAAHDFLEQLSTVAESLRPLKTRQNSSRSRTRRSNGIGTWRALGSIVKSAGAINAGGFFSRYRMVIS